MKEDTRKAIDIVTKLTPIKFPYHVARFFEGNSQEIEFATKEQISFGEDYGSLGEIREAVAWFVNQLGGTVKWKKSAPKSGD